MIAHEEQLRTGEWALRGRAVFTPEGIRPAAVLIHDERIAAVVDYDEVPADMRIEDAGEKLVLPGLVDTHVHINEPGRTDWEGFETATRAAAAGGITTLIDMPLNSSPVTTTVDALLQKQEAAKGKIWVDVGFHGGVVPGNAEHIEPLIAAGVCAFKAFLCPSGLDEFPASSEADLRAVMPKLAKAGLPLFVHAELMLPLRTPVEEAFANDPDHYAAYLATRPPEWEVAAVRLLIDLCRENHCPVHVVHLSAAVEAEPFIKKARADGVPLTVETCPHYLYFSAEDVPDADPSFKCAPPIRGKDENGRLRIMAATGVIDTLGSDHSPAPPEMKYLREGDLRRAWGGIASLQLLLPATWTALAEICRPGRLVNMLTDRPAMLVGLGHRKGTIAPSRDADLVIFDPKGGFVVGNLFHRHKVTPYVGRTLVGVVQTTYLRGRKVYDRGRIVGEAGGQLLKREST
jgi:allantoinase